MKKILLAAITLFIAVFLEAQNIYPTHWWVGMNDPRLQLLIHNDNAISGDKISFQSSSKDVKVVKVHRVENPRYLFVDLEIARTAKPQKVKFTFGGAQG